MSMHWFLHVASHWIWTIPLKEFSILPYHESRYSDDDHVSSPNFLLCSIMSVSQPFSVLKKVSVTYWPQRSFSTVFETVFFTSSSNVWKFPPLAINISFTFLPQAPSRSEQCNMLKILVYFYIYDSTKCDIRVVRIVLIMWTILPWHVWYHKISCYHRAHWRSSMLLRWL